MPITANEGGVLKELETIPVNENGVLYELDTVHANENGILYEIFSAHTLPTSLEWYIATADAAGNPWCVVITNPGPVPTIKSTENNGLTITYEANSSLDIYSNRVSLKTGDKITFDVTSMSGKGSTMTYANIDVYKVDSNVGNYPDTYAEYSHHVHTQQPTYAWGGTYTIESDGEYIITLNGTSVTMGQTPVYYTATDTVSISFSKGG